MQGQEVQVNRARLRAGSPGRDDYRNEEAMKKKETKKATTLRPLGDKVLVLFDQSDWKVERGILVKTGIFGTGYRMDGFVVAAGPKAPEEISVGRTVYADPRVADVVVLEGTRYHLFRAADVLAVAEPEVAK